MAKNACQERAFLNGIKDFVKAGLILKMMIVHDAQPYQKPLTLSEKLKKIVREDCRLSIRLIAERMSTDKKTVLQVLHDNLHMTKSVHKLFQSFYLAIKRKNAKRFAQTF